MSDALKVVAVEFGNLSDISDGLRALAARIEEGQYGDHHNLAWAIDCGNGDIQIGLLGKAPEPGITAYYLFGHAMQRLLK